MRTKGYALKARGAGYKACPRDALCQVQRPLIPADAVYRRHIDVQRAAGGPARMEDARQAIELGRRLGATWVVAGAVQRMGERVRVTGQTIAVEEGHTVSSVKVLFAENSGKSLVLMLSNSYIDPTMSPMIAPIMAFSGFLVG